MGEVTPRKLAAVLFSDIKGYSKQMGEDEAGTLRRLGEHNRIFREQADRHHGRVVKTVGDAFMVEFASAVDAVGCALDVQRALHAYNTGRIEAERIEVRIGVHLGDVVVQDNDLFGETVNLAARLEPKAPPGGVCVTDTVFQQVRRRVKATASDLGEQPLKNIAQPMRLYALIPSESLLVDAAPVPSSERAAAPERHAGEHLFRHGLLIALVISLSAIAVFVVVRKPHVATTAELRVGMPEPLGAMDPYTQVPGIGVAAMQYVVEPLMKRSVDGNIAPWLIEKLEEQDGGRTALLHVRKDVRIHEHPCVGKDLVLTAEDVRFSLEQSLPFFPSGALPIVGLGGFLAKKTPHIDGITASADVVTIKLTHPSPFLDVVMTRILAVPAGIARCNMTLSSMHHAVGTGPYRFVRAAQGDVVELVRAEGYWNAAASGHAQRLVFASVPGIDDAARRIQAGTLDTFSLRPAEAMARVSGLLDGKPVLGVPDITVAVETTRFDHTTWSIIGLRGREGEGALSHVGVRQALAHALDREALVKAHPLHPRPTGRLLEPRHLGHSLDVTGYGLDLARARTLLAEAGFPDGKGLPPITIGVNVREADIAKLLEQQWSALGVSVRAVEMDRNALDLAVMNRNVDGVVVTHTEVFSGSEPFPFLFGVASFLELFLGARPGLRDLTEAIAKEMDRRQRGALYSKLERALLDAVWIFPIAVFPPESPSRVHLVSNRLRGLIDATSGHVPDEESLPLLNAVVEN